MKVLSFSVGEVTNSEVLQVLEEHGSDSTGDKSLGLPSERKVHEYLRGQKTRPIPREGLKQFTTEMKEKYNLTPREILQIANLMPMTQVEIYLIVADCDERLDERQIEDIINFVKTKLKS
mmetsp:Transcript_8882/g.25598  ORF Transcript_8882/g.25598 Transcript_8882/m.25598 type:complete len:120 (+) Transcript_8882:198-557(+)|eukprot:CAMPEP_0117679414 /NCGR_PEP_ID=MMETSP0804-20121206/17802_1 /TAXON_ID=1074897 /ORGANISM="Tetraselmis astigmatica, Strain CCMP880" /LENGTH=119 /DNA_ID=CAMNT_0005488835 /DNA_START=102 /DNA_END=461 /DNA_ORIENTATION=-